MRMFYVFFVIPPKQIWKKQSISGWMITDAMAIMGRHFNEDNNYNEFYIILTSVAVRRLVFSAATTSVFCENQSIHCFLFSFGEIRLLVWGSLVFWR